MHGYTVRNPRRCIDWSADAITARAKREFAAFAAMVFVGMIVFGFAT